MDERTSHHFIPRASISSQICDRYRPRRGIWNGVAFVARGLASVEHGFGGGGARARVERERRRQKGIFFRVSRRDDRGGGGGGGDEMSFRASMMKASTSAPIASSSTRGVEKNRAGLVRMPRGKSDACRCAVSALESKSRYASGVVDASSSSSTALSMTEKRRRNDVPTEVNDYRRIARKNRRNRDRLSVNKAIFDSRDEDKEASENNSMMINNSPRESCSKV